MKIKVTKNGPYEVSGKTPLEREEIQADKKGTSCNWKKTGGVKTENDCRLCRCGKSSNKPFCDGNHIDARFKE